MERLTKKIAGKVILPLIPMDIKNKDDLETYHKARKQYEENTIKLAEYEDLEEQGLLLRLEKPFEENISKEGDNKDVT